MRRSVTLFVVVLLIASVSATLAQSPAVLSITKTDTPEPIIPGNLLTYTMVGTNNGPGAVLDFTIADPLPGVEVFISAVASPGATLTTPAVGVNGTVTAVWDAAGGTPGGLTAATVQRTLTAVVRLCPETGCITIPNTASVDSASPDVPANVTEDTTATAESNLSISKTGPPQVVAGHSFSFLINVANAGPSTSSTTRVIDTLPPGFIATGTQSTIPGTTCTITNAGQTITCDFALGANNQCVTTFPLSGTLTIDVTVAPDTNTGTYTNTATIGISGACGTDPDPANNTATASLRVVGAPGAPVASPLGVAMLVMTLGALGAWVLRRSRAN